MNEGLCRFGQDSFVTYIGNCGIAATGANPVAANITVELRPKKKRLHDVGVDAELVRLLCRHLSNPRNPYAEKRFQERENVLRQLPLF